MNLQSPLSNSNRSYKMFSGRLEKIGIKRIEDFLYHIPFRYEDFSVISNINQVQEGEIVTIQGTVEEIKNVFTRNRKKLQEATVADETGKIKVIWFNQMYLLKSVHKGDIISLSGRVQRNKSNLMLYSPEFEIIFEDAYEKIHTGRLVPIYPETRGVTSKWIRRQVFKIIKDTSSELDEYLPNSVLKKYDFMDLKTAIEQIHFPNNLNNSIKARERLGFDEVFLLQLAAKNRRQEWQKKLTGNPFKIDQFKSNIADFWKSLPFELTNGQKKAVSEIYADLANVHPMNRMLQGDVGSGKTVVATIGMYLSYLNGYQSVLIAPTEILAQQHFATISKLLQSLGVKIELVTANKKPESKNYDILVGTHALFSEKIIFTKLGFIVIDEQQRFGVEQRSILRKKGNNPHLLTMTATPIPRTIALTIYGDLDLSTLSEMPKGRKKIKTWLVPNQKREASYKWIEKQIKENNDQAFIVCPFVEESESIKTVKAATKEFDYLQKNVFPSLKLGLLHGRMKQKEKDEVLNSFKNNKTHILVATPVVEVGIDIPNATIIVIEAAERFGLAQLHQLRGRVGRGDKQSYCLLFTQAQSISAKNRLSAMGNMHVGSELAELDLKLRGPGDLYGTMQSGQRMLKIATYSNFELLEKAKKESDLIFPELNKYPKLREKLLSISSSNISPD